MATLNLDYYRGPDAYSEGAVEDELLALVQQHQDFASVLARDQRWSILYHLSPARRALLDWYPMEPNADLLEIGAGCGALTGLFCEKAARVTAVELSEKRSRIIYHRYEQVPHLEVVAGNMMDIPFERAFDYITLIGVMEYARSFIRSPDPCQALLRHLASALKPAGQLIIAVENRYGIKYFAGAAEEHTGRLFDGIEGYPIEVGIETFSKDELSRGLESAGLTDCRWYYPYPDYKFPAEIFSDRHLPGINHKFHNAPNYDQDRFQLFSEKLALRSLVRNQRFDFFSNAFLVSAAKG
ncbi:MAG: class I SAM-dependent methyltransferase [Verrucomicrobia bacterium]|nr:class I SAM-dependent methyltransferase [Verrucomicrobiota bacterium]MBU4292402.1 class I SAM-dependent methyltransferase [Verrucomicrobiota bacterium]MBU4429778.1 class I SAM-dependent methyltransferase [Verrucomicrobiota bacterium]MBU4497345.1 class I SAM-dependent methyltransferase [Verrucomicrobiota bacterium]MCG2679825.1 class I SAM-dependent methyltransferase [Kiritimatiellia bacterium]